MKNLINQVLAQQPASRHQPEQKHMHDEVFLNGHQSNLEDYVMATGQYIKSIMTSQTVISSIFFLFKNQRLYAGACSTSVSFAFLRTVQGAEH